MSKPLSNTTMVQVGVIVKDIRKSARAYAKLFGVPVPGIHLTDGLEKTNARYKGKPTKARAKLAFFKAGPLSIELIEPVGRPSTWGEFLDKKGEGPHHIAFMVADSIAEEKNLAKHGLKVVQKGDYTGGRYSYVEGKPLAGVIIELLQNV